MVRALKINDRDNCAVLLADVRNGETVEVRTEAGISSLTARGLKGLGAHPNVWGREGACPPTREMEKMHIATVQPK